MLTPEQLDKFPDRLVELYAQVEADIIADMCRRISTYDYYIPAAQWQYKKLMDMGKMQEYIMQELSSQLNVSWAYLEDIFEQASIKTIEFDDHIYEKVGLNARTLKDSPALISILNEGLEKTHGLFRNLTRTTAAAGSHQFEMALDRAYMQIITGAFDSNTAIRNAIKDLASKGLAAITYPNGHINYMDAAVRRAVVTGVNQTALKMQETRAQEMGSDLVETSAHAGARPSHAVWQGKVFSLSGAHPKYPDFKKETGYGTGAGLGGWNCRHSFYPFFEGLSKPAYTDEELKDYKAEDITYNGEKLTEYEATQKQREIERNIRRWKREYKAMEAVGLPTDEAAAKIAKWQGIEKDFLKQTGLKRQIDREQIPGFGKSEARKVTATAKKLKNENPSILKTPTEPTKFADVDIAGKNENIPGTVAPEKIINKLSSGLSGDGEVQIPKLIEKVNPLDIDKTIKKIENEIRSLPKENVIIALPDGSFYKAVGDSNSVTFKGLNLKGSIITHNHPIDEFGISDSFGEEDFSFIKNNQTIKKLRAVNTNYDYELKILKPLDISYNEAYRNGLDKIVPEDEIQHYVMEWLHKEGYIEYRRTSVKSE